MLARAQLLQANLHSALLLENSLVRRQRLCGNLILPSARSNHNLSTRVRWSPVTTSPLKMKHRLSQNSTCPLIFHVLSAPCLSKFSSAPSFPFTSSFILYIPLFISLLPHLWLSSSRSLGIITQCTGWHFIHYHIKRLFNASLGCSISTADADSISNHLDSTVVTELDLQKNSVNHISCIFAQQMFFWKMHNQGCGPKKNKKVHRGFW